MKRAAAGVACLTAVLNAAHAAPAARPRTQAEATLGNALKDSIDEAIRGAVTKIKARKARASEISSPPEHYASAALSVGRNATQMVAAKTQPHILAQRTSLRGSSTRKVREANPWEPVKPLRVIDHDLNPVAPLDVITPGVEAQQGGLLPPGYWPRFVYHPPHQDIVNPFPQNYENPVPAAPQNFLSCKSAPSGWADKKGANCEFYGSAAWCTSDGREGPKWKKSWGALKDFANSLGIAAFEACCECGGGIKMKIIGHPGERDLEKRHLLSAPDRLPDPSARWFERNNFHLNVPLRPVRPNQAPEDYVPLPIRQVAPADRMGPSHAEDRYARYFKEINDQKGKANPRGFSVRYYSAPPEDCKGVQPQATSLDLSLEYGMHTDSLLTLNSSANLKPVYLNAKNLEWPTKKAPVGGVFWAKWSGTLMVLEPGRYTFNLDLGFESNSWLKVDGINVLTDGQCKSSQEKPSCMKLGCKWSKDDGECKAAGDEHELAETPTLCKKGEYRSAPILFGCNANTGTAEMILKPAGATPVLTVPAGVENFHVTVESDINVDLQMKDTAADTWIVKFMDGIVNNQQREGTYHGMSVAFSGASPAHEFAKLNGVTTSPIQVSVMSYSGNPATVKLIFSHLGLKKCPGKKAPPKGCEKFTPDEGKEHTVKWSTELLRRYKQCPVAWAAVKESYPGGQITWGQFETVWSMAWGQETAIGAPGGQKAWQIGFSVVDSSHDGFVSEEEFLQTCSLMAGAPMPAPAPAAAAPPPTGPNQDVSLKTCLSVKIMDKVSWPKDPFKGSGFKDDPLLEQVIGSTAFVDSEDEKGVMVPSPDGKQKWFFPKGTYYCVQADGNERSAGAPAATVSTRGPAPSIANIVPQIMGGPPQMNFEAIQLDEDLPPAKPVENSMDLAAGGHCIEAMVMVTPSARNLHLKYTGPDTHKRETIVPGQLVHCDPVIPACATPLRDTCLLYRKQCPAPAPAPAGGDSSAPASGFR